MSTDTVDYVVNVQHLVRIKIKNITIIINKTLDFYAYWFSRLKTIRTVKIINHYHYFSLKFDYSFMMKNVADYSQPHSASMCIALDANSNDVVGHVGVHYLVLFEDFHKDDGWRQNILVHCGTAPVKNACPHWTHIAPCIAKAVHLVWQKEIGRCTEGLVTSTFNQFHLQS